MMQKKRRRFCLVFCLLSVVPAAVQVLAQNSNSLYLRQAAQAYYNAANSCSDPAGKACYKAWGDYENNVANGGSPAQPSCTPGCAAGGTMSVASSATAPNSGASGLSTLSQAICNSGTDRTVCTLSQLQAANAAGQLNTSGGQAQAVGQLVGLGLGMLFNRHSNDSTEPAQSADDSAARQAALEAQANLRRMAEADKTLQDSNALLASLNPAPLNPSNAGPNPNSVLDSLLDNGQPYNSSTAAINSLLDDSAPAGPAGASPTATIASLLTPATGDSSTPASEPLINSVTQNPQFRNAYSQLQDRPPDPKQVAGLNDSFLDDKVPDPSLSDIWHGMTKTATNWANSAGDLINDASWQSISSAVSSKLGLTLDPNADAVQTGLHNCGISMTAGALPNPVGGDAAAVGCANAFQNAVDQGLDASGLATDQ
jgi:hypothetical protein